MLITGRWLAPLFLGVIQKSEKDFVKFLYIPGGIGIAHLQNFVNFLVNLTAILPVNLTINLPVILSPSNTTQPWHVVLTFHC